MIIIKPNDEYPKAKWLNTEFPALIIDNFLSEEIANILKSDGEDFINSEINLNKEIHGGRVMIPWTSSNFDKLKIKSKIWEEFSNQFEQKVYKIIKDNLDSLRTKKTISISSISDLQKSNLSSLNKYKLSPRIKIKNFHKKYKNFLELTCRSIPPSKLAIISIVRILDSLWRRIVSYSDLIKGNIPLIPLFDYSFSKIGYTREIHRDSDNRLIVILLYLNSLDENAIGGDLELYKLKDTKGRKVGDYPPKPAKEACKLQYKIQPRRGRLIIFLNQCNSYHGVSKMINNKKGRHFIYGGFTVPSSIFVKNTRLHKSKWQTEMHLY